MLVRVYMLAGATAFAQPPANEPSPWRRTAAGWERLEDWSHPLAPHVVAPLPPVVPHPALFAVIIASIAIAALLLPARRQTGYHEPERRRPHLRRKTDRSPSGA